MCKKEIQLSNVHSHLEECSVLLIKGRCIYPDCTYNIKSAADLYYHLTTDLIAHSIYNTSAISNMREQVITPLELYTKTRKEREQGLEMQVNNLQGQVTTMKNISYNNIRTSTDSSGLRKEIITKRCC